MQSRTWKKIPPDRFDELRELLLRLGATEDEEVRGQSELWRCRVDDGVFTMYETGTLHFSGAKSRESEIAARGGPGLRLRGGERRMGTLPMLCRN